MQKVQEKRDTYMKNSTSVLCLLLCLGPLFTILSFFLEFFVFTVFPRQMCDSRSFNVPEYQMSGKCPLMIITLLFFTIVD